MPWIFLFMVMQVVCIQVSRPNEYVDHDFVNLESNMLYLRLHVGRVHDW